MPRKINKQPKEKLPENPEKLVKCKKCQKGRYLMVVPNPTKCSNRQCERTFQPPHYGAWKFCGKCAIRLGRCALCGEKLKK